MCSLGVSAWFGLCGSSGREVCGFGVCFGQCVQF